MEHNKIKYYIKRENLLEQLLKNYEDNNELEIRLGFFKKNNFTALNEYNTFQSFISFFENLNFSKSIVFQEINMYDNRIKYVKTILPFISSYTVKKIVKKIVNLPEVNIRLALNHEIIIDKLPNKKSYFKYRTRITFTHPYSLYKVDMSIDENLQGKINYQIEVEFLRKPTLTELINTLIFIENIRDKK